MSTFSINPTSSLQHLIDARRHNPCDACRLRRRKCDYVIPICGRCKKMGKKCVYLRNLTPGDQEYEQSFQSSNEIDLHLQPEEIFEIFRQLEVMEYEMAALRKTGRFQPVPNIVEIKTERESSPSDSDTTTDESTCSTSLTDPSGIDSPTSETVSVKDENLDIITTNDQSLPIAPTSLKDRSSSISTLDAVSNSADMLVHTFGWKFTIARSGVQIDTTIRSFRDLLALLAAKSLRPPPTESSIVMTKNKVMQDFMNVLRINLKNNSQTNDIHTRNPSPTMGAALSDAILTKTFVDNVQVYFACSYNPSPTMDVDLFVANMTKTFVDNVLEVYLACSYSFFPLIHPTVLSQLYKKDDPLASPAICIIVARTLQMTCSHIKRNINLAQNMFERMYKLVGDSMFDEPDEPNLTNFIAVSFASEFSIGAMQLKKSWHFRGLSYRMGNIMIQNRYRAMTPFPDRHRPLPPPVSLEEWETFKRIYLITTAIDACSISAHIYDTFGILNPLITEIDVPTPLPDETHQSRRAVRAMSHLFLLPRVLMNVKNTKQSTLRDISEANTNLCDWYKSLPEDMCIPTYATAKDDDIELLRSMQIDQITAHTAVQYHCMVIRIHEQFLPEDPTAVVSSIVEPILEICTRCADIITAVFQNHAKNPPCIFYAPAILVSCDVHYRNMLSANPFVKERGILGMEANLQVTSTLFQDCDFYEMLRKRMNKTLKRLGIENMRVRVDK